MARSGFCCEPWTITRRFSFCAFQLAQLLFPLVRALGRDLHLGVQVLAQLFHLVVHRLQAAGHIPVQIPPFQISRRPGPCRHKQADPNPLANPQKNGVLKYSFIASNKKAPIARHPQAGIRSRPYGPTAYPTTRTRKSRSACSPPHWPNRIDLPALAAPRPLPPVTRSTNSRLPTTAPSVKYRTRIRNITPNGNRPPRSRSAHTFLTSIPLPPLCVCHCS